MTASSSPGSSSSSALLAGAALLTGALACTVLWPSHNVTHQGRAEPGSALAADEAALRPGGFFTRPDLLRTPTWLGDEAPQDPPATEASALTPAAGAAPAGLAANAALNIAMSAPRQLLVGETAELAVSVGPHAGVAEIRFSVQVDANVLQLRAAQEGDWGATAGTGTGTGTRFSADIAATEDQARLQVGAVPTAARHGGRVALLQFQAVAPGSASVLLSDVTVTDGAGRVLPFVLMPSNLQVLAEPLPPAPPAPKVRTSAQQRAHAAPVHEPEPAEDGD